MSAVLKPTRLAANDREDLVDLRLGDRHLLIPYRIAFEVGQAVRVGAKQAAAHDQAPGTFWRELAGDDPRLDHDPPSRQARHSGRAANFRRWEVRCNPPLVALVFDGLSTEVHYEDAIRLQDMIFRAAHRAKAWAGDTSRSARLLANLTASAT